MRKHFLLKTMLLLCALIVGSSSAWADESYSLTPDGDTTGSSATTYITNLTEFTCGEVKWKMNYWNPSTLQVKTNQANAADEFRFYNTSAFAGRITKVVITFSALTIKTDCEDKFMFKGGTSEVTATTGGTAGTWDNTKKVLTWEPGASDNFTYFAFYQDGKAASGNNFLAETDAIVVTYETSGPSAKVSTTSLAFGEVAVGTTKSLTFTVTPANLTGNLTIASNNGKYTVSPTTIAQDASGAQTITVTAAPTALDDDMEGTITISGGGLASNKTVTLTASPYQVANVTLVGDNGTFKVNNEPATSLTFTSRVGNTATIKAVANSGYEFISWSAVGATPASSSDAETEFTFTSTEVTLTASFGVKLSSDYVKVTDANTLRAGDQLILVYEGGSLALGAINSSGKYYESASVTINEGVITDPTGVAVLTLGGEEDAWTIKSSLSGNYLSLTSNSNELKAAASVGDDKTEEWTISISDGNVYIINNKYSQKDNKDRYIQWNSSSSGLRFACYTGSQNDLQLYRLSKSVTITAAEYATYCGNKALNFDGVGIKAYTATDGKNSVKLNEITSGKVPANTPVVLYKAGGGTVDVPVIASADAIEGTNDLRVSEGAAYSNAYVLAMNPTIGFYLWDSSATLNAGKIYLQGKASYGARSFLGFEEGNTTGVADINRETITNNGSFYNLNGQRVAQPTKGLYIVNGKKFVVK